MKNTVEQVDLQKRNIIISESEDKAYLIAKFIICDFNANGNNVKLQRNNAQELLSTLNGMPVVGKLVIDDNGDKNFSGHNLKKKYIYNSEKGTLEVKYYFDTECLGVLYDAQIETIDDKEYITAKSKIWTRNENEVNVIKKLYEKGLMKSSWEILSKDYYMESNIKVLTNYEWLGNCLLGSNITPAYKCAGITDISNGEDETVVSELNNKKNNNDKQVGGNKEMAENNNQVASLTDNDLYVKVREAINKTSEDKYYYIAYVFPYEYKAYAYTWSSNDTDFVEFTYTVNSDDTVSIVSQKDVQMHFTPVSQTQTTLAEKDTKITELSTKVGTLEKELSEKNESLVKAGEEIKSKDTLISELQPFKDQIEKAEKEKKEAEVAEKKESLRQYALSSGYISEDELATPEIAEFINNIDEKSIKSIIADKVIAELNSKQSKDSKVETSSVEEKNITTNLNTTDNEEEYRNSSDIMSKFLTK